METDERMEMITFLGNAVGNDNGDGGCVMCMAVAWGRLTTLVGWLGLKVVSHLALRLHAWKKLGELLQWLYHGDDTQNIGVIISIALYQYNRAQAILE